MAFFFRKKKLTREDLRVSDFVLTHFGFRPSQIDLYRTALRHKSIADRKLENNERLEYLGDAVLDTITAEYLFRIYKNRKEGFLSKMKSKIVSRENLNTIAKKMDFEELLEYRLSGENKSDSLAGNAFEAIIGAIYLENGFDFTRSVLLRKVFKKYIDVHRLEQVDTDYKSQLFILSQQSKQTLEFEVVNVNEQTNQKVYIIQVKIDNKPIAQGKGTSKKRAEQAASQRALRLLRTKNS